LTQLTSAGMQEQAVAEPTTVVGGERGTVNEADTNAVGLSGGDGTGEAGDFGDRVGNGSGGTGAGGFGDQVGNGSGGTGAGGFGDRAGNGSGGTGAGGVHVIGGAAPRYPVAARKAG
jgi:hypothetical protein